MDFAVLIPFVLRFVKYHKLYKSTIQHKIALFMTAKHNLQHLFAAFVQGASKILSHIAVLDMANHAGPGNNSC